jgi:hypothetical protein
MWFLCDCGRFVFASVAFYGKYDVDEVVPRSLLDDLRRSVHINPGNYPI